MSSPWRENMRTSLPRAAIWTRMPSHFHSATKSSGRKPRPVIFLDRMRQHHRSENGFGAGIGTVGLAVEPREKIEIGWLKRVPDLFDFGDVSAVALGQAPYGRDAPKRRRAALRQEVSKVPSGQRHRADREAGPSVPCAQRWCRPTLRSMTRPRVSAVGWHSPLLICDGEEGRGGKVQAQRFGLIADVFIAPRRDEGKRRTTLSGQSSDTVSAVSPT